MEELAFGSTTVDRPMQRFQHLCCLRAEMHGVVVSGLLGHVRVLQVTDIKLDVSEDVERKLSWCLSTPQMLKEIC